MSATDPVTPEPRRYSICLPRPLWIGMAAVVLVIVGIGLRIGVPIYRQHLAIREIERLGGKIVKTSPRGPEWLRKLVGDEWMKAFDDVVYVDLHGPRAVEAALCHMKVLTSLQVLCLDDVQIPNAKLTHLKGLTSLEKLYLKNTDVTDSGLIHLEALAQLRWLDLAGTRVTDAGVADLKRASPGLTIRR